MESHHNGGHELQEFSHIELLVEENDHERMIPELANYLMHVWSEDKTRKISEKEAQKKSKDIVEGVPRRTDIPPKWHNTANISRYSLIKDAVKKGYLKSFRIRSPWHPKEFLNPDTLTTYPFQHEEMIYFRADNKEIFFEKDETSGNEKEQVSVLKKGYLSGKNGIGPMDNAFDPSNNLPHGVYGSFLKIAEEYRPEVVFELKVPTSDMVVHYRKSYLLNNLEKIHDEFGSPENMRQEAKKANMQNEMINFFAKREVPLEMVEGVWDVENFTKPMFEPLSKYIKSLKRDDEISLDEEKMPEYEEKMKHEIKSLRSLLSSLNQMREALERIEYLFEEKSPEFFVNNQASNRRYRRIEGLIENYNKAHFEFFNTCKHIFGRDNINQKVSNIGSYKKFVNEFEEILNAVKGLEAEADKSYNKELEYLRDFEQQKIDEEEVSSEEKFRKAVNREIIDKSLKLPNLEPVQDKIGDKTKNKAF